MNESIAVNLVKDLIRIDSTNPGAYEKEIKDYIKNWLSPLPGVIITEEEVLPGRFNLMAELPADMSDMSSAPPALVFICHMDTVVVGDGWTLSPFGAEEKDGKIYGRGACDMKAGLACCMAAFAEAAKRAHEEGIFPKRPLKLICSMDEEDFMRGSEAAIRSDWVTKDDWVMDSEPTNRQIQVAHKGRTWYVIDVQGHTAHASTPWKGCDAIAAMAEIIHKVRLAIEDAPTHPDLGRSTVTFGQIQGGYRPYVVPDSAKLWIDMRLVPPLNTERTSAIIEKAIEHAKKSVPGIEASYTVTGDRPPIEKDDNSPFLHALIHACEGALGKTPVVSCFTGYTDTAVIAGQLGNHNCMSYGPGNLENAHQPDEFVTTEAIERCVKVYTELTKEVF
ncbi:MAG: M20 family metallopeptidase [Schaedlerella sp.]|nr:M20 family metallopeptidase [Schaedlerella sp.]